MSRAILAWMRRHVRDHVDPLTAEGNCTGLVEAWDAESSGESTLDTGHAAWDLAVKVAAEYERTRKATRASQSELAADYSRHLDREIARKGAR